ncbi:MAG: alpha/beta fold hydrolase, partial [Paracoccaceae bacterium]
DPVFFAAARVFGPAGTGRREEEFNKNLSELLARDPEQAVSGFVKHWGDGQAWQDIPPDQRQYMTERIHLIPYVNAQLVEDRAGLLPRLGEITIPVLLIRGEKSPPVMAGICAALTQNISGARQVTIKGASHMGPITHPHETADEIARFYAGIDK